MIVQAITAILLSILVLLMTWAVYRTLRKPMPGVLVPLLIGVTVIAYGIYSEYTWEARTLEKLPDSVEVIHRFSGESVFSPWSFLVPRTDQLSLVDTATIRRNADFPNQAILDLLLVRRFNPVMRTTQLVDCESNRRADLVADTRFDESGSPVNPQWDTLPAGHRLLEAVCGG